jgi:hypothetical protein
MANTETTNVLSHSEIEKICLELSYLNVRLELSKIKKKIRSKVQL